MTKKTKDPYADRESKRYEHPIVSREYILQILKIEQKPLSRSVIARQAAMHSREQLVALERRLEAMVRDGQLTCENRRYALCSGAAISVSELLDRVTDHFQLPIRWAEAVLQEVEQLPEEPDCQTLGSRHDLRHLPFVTIDGEDAKDFDDAVYCQSVKNGFKLYVAIADVSHYVKPGTALDHTATERGNSVYFPGRVLPMLPEKLSNGLCSLKPKVNRFCTVCEMEISQKGELSSYQFYSAVICSQARLTYSNVAKWLKGDVQEADPKILPHLLVLYRVYQALFQNRTERGALDIDAVETRVTFDEAGQVNGIMPVHRNDAHRLIEECMLVANVAAGQFLLRAKMPAPFRIHDRPDAVKTETLRDFLSLRGILLTGGMEPPTSSFNQVLHYAKVRPDFSVVQTMVLRTMQQAVYSPHNIGHFGLAYQSYTHFTSPIRRYADLLVHRQLKAAIAKRNSHYSVEQLEKICTHVSETERKADEASRSATQALKCLYLSQHLGSSFEVVISGVTAFGVFATITEWMVDGLIHIRNLRDDYYHFDDKAYMLVGERSGRSFHLGDVLQIRVAKVDVEQGRIDFELLNDDRTATSRTRRSSKPKAVTAAPLKKESGKKRTRSFGKVRQRKS